MRYDEVCEAHSRDMELRRSAFGMDRAMARYCWRACSCCESFALEMLRRFLSAAMRFDI
jgi:hypothetical protein